MDVSENGVYPRSHGIAMKMMIIQWINPDDMSQDIDMDGSPVTQWKI
jgi:hypothetical protein